MSETEKQAKFIKDTLDKVHSDITKFIIDTNYSNVKSIHLRNELEQYKAQMLKRENQIKKRQIINNQNINQYLLPLLDNIHNPNLCIPDSSLFTQKIKNKNVLRGFQDINTIKEKENIKSFSPKRKRLKINTDNIYNIEKYYKFNNDSKNSKFFHPKIFDKYNNSVIRNKDISQGIYDMNVKKLIPKGADVSLTMNIWGSPVKIIGNDVKNTYKKCSSRDEVAPGELNKLKPNKYNLQDFYKTQPTLNNLKKSKHIRNMASSSFLNNKYSLSSNINNTNNTNGGFISYKDNLTNYNNIKDKDNIFITEDSSSFNITNNRKTFNNLNIYDSNLNNINRNMNKRSNTFYDILNQKKFNYTYNSAQRNSKDFSNNYNSKILTSFYKTDSRNKNSFYNFIKNINMKNNLIIKYHYFELVIDDDYYQFKQRNKKIWKRINNILANFNILFEKLNINNAYIDSNKILKLLEFYHGTTKNITNKDLLMCLTKTDLRDKGYDPDNENVLYGRIKEAFIIRIQKTYRKRLAIKKYKEIKFLNKCLVKLQKNIKAFLVRKKALLEIENNKILISNEYNEIFKQFKNDYDDIQSGPRIEIHINSLSYNGNYNDCLTDKYPMKENLQLNRLIRLVDPKVEIIYIIPYELSEEILSYYYSILENIGITNLEKRVHFLVPESTEFLPLNYSLSKLLFFSHRTLMEITKLVYGKKCYIIPGIIGDIEEKLSVALNIPILMSPKNQIDLIFNKSEVKSSFEINEIPFPISAWNIITEEEFYSSLAHLIATYPNVKIWIFKSNLDSNATGIAYLNTDKIDIINQLKKEKKLDKNFSNDKFREKLFVQLRNILIKNVTFAFPNLYKNWNDYLNHFLLNKGAIECCPTKELSGIMGRPCVPILIEPNGKVKILPTFEKINVDFFKNVICTSPQKCLDNIEMTKLGEKIGDFLFTRGIVGYVTIDCITFHNGKKVLYWCVDMKYGYTQTICDIQYCYFLNIQSKFQKDIINKDINIINDNEDFKINNNFNIDFNSDSDNENNKKDNDINRINDNDNNNNISKSSINNYLNNDKEMEKILSDLMIFSLPYMTNDLIKEIKLKDLLREYRYNNIVFNTVKREGIIINLCDGLECGIFGLCGVINLEDIERVTPELKLWKLIETCANLLKNLIFKIKKLKVASSISKYYNNNNERNDKIDSQEIINKIKKMVKEKEIEQQKEENRRKKLANSPFI